MYSIELLNLNEVVSALNSFPEKAGVNVNDAIRKSVVTIQREAMKGAPVDTGKLRADWDLSYSHLSGTLRNRSKYAIFMEEGTRPHFPPLEAVTPWANRHGIAPFLVARAIAKKGTKARRFFGNAIDGTKTTVNEFFTEALNKTMQEI